MCGIVGYLSFETNNTIIKKMLSIQNHRGPDDSGIFIEKISDTYVHLGHNRLAIQDLSALGHQPFISDCGNYTIVFNGEVYNFNEIREKLKKSGYSFISTSDTEVILYAYKEWGIKCLDQFIGMFAFTILDKVKSKIYLIRDRAGVKPLYYYNKDNTFIFASELKSFHSHPNFKNELNKEVLPYYFQFGYIPAPYTIFKNTSKLEPAHYLVYDLKEKSYEIIKYWSVEECYKKEKFDKSETEILIELEKLLTNAIELRMVSDVPVGIFLSGGYDSSLVTGLLSKNKNRKIHTYTIGFKDKKYNEAEHAKIIAKHFGTIHTEYYISKEEMLNKVKKLAFYYDEPFGDSSAIATMIVSELAKKEVTVALSADGGDEAFCGYSKYFFLNKFSSVYSNKFQNFVLKNSIKIFNTKKIEWINSRLPKRIQQTNIADKYNKFKRAMNTDSLEEMFLNASSSVDAKEVKQFLNIPLKRELYQKFSMKTKESLLDNMMSIDYRTFMVDDVLTKVDRATMSVSLEGREPLLDHRIIEFLAQVPSELKYKNQQGKYLARKLLYQYIPKEIIDKPKAGFQIPLLEWLQTDLRPLIEKYLDSSQLDEEIFNKEEIKKMQQALFNNQEVNVSALWFILMFQMWKEVWNA